MPVKTRVKVKTAELRRAVVKRREAMIAEHQKATTSYPQRQEAYQAAVVAALEAALTRARSGKLPKHCYYGLAVPIRHLEPQEPHLQTCDVDRLIKTLDMAAENSILLSQDDLAAYFGPCTTNGRRGR